MYTHSDDLLCINFRWYRTNVARLSQQKFAEHIGINVANCRAYEQGRAKPNVDVLRKLREQGVDLNRFVCENLQNADPADFSVKED